MFDNITDQKVAQDLGNHGNINDNNSTRCPKFIRFFVTNRLYYSKELITTIEIIQKIINSEIDKIDENVGRDLSNHGDSNSSSNTRHPKYISCQSIINQVILSNI